MSDPGVPSSDGAGARPGVRQGAARALRAGVRPPPGPAPRCAAAAGISRRRRGVVGELQTPWRRLSIGTNHITNYGLWHKGARRAVPRVNRTGGTRWHRPYTEIAARPVPVGRSG